ncbi:MULTISPECIES: TolC family outer membrane protein [unclassified Pseudomonas]|uniref:TolC family outer membrane protein n=1 Tax=unclassified Pseudomonas TaxID=196821 RepID=UPI0024496E60|nr:MULTISPECIES: TolC family outer membrane protein [unclassified Pseudomonas]MDH0303107.1 TolC family outer membrane protein [Pseudomonas sp. GD04091]MDH1985950.1 TolC family outer membrane protein [Pseudomonas sp. GD03689]
MRLLLPTLLLGLSFPVQALDLGDAYALALRNDPTWQGSIAERAAGLENLAIGRAGLLPRLSYRYNRARNDSQVTQRSQFGDVTTQRDYRSYSSTLTLEQPLFDYAAWSDYRRGVAQAALADERYRGRGQELMVRLFGAYSEALFANEQIALAQAQRRTYAEQLTLNERLLKGGEGTRTDVLETRARYELAQAQEIEAGDNLDAALRALQAIIGEPVAVEDLAPMTGDFRVQPLTPARFEPWRELAVAHNAELASQRHGLEVAEQNIERQRAGHLPSLSAYASKGISSSSSESSYNQRYDTDSIGVQLSVPLFAGGGVSASVRQARAQRDAAGFELDAQLRDTVNQLRRQFNLCASGTAKIRAYDLAVKAASALVQATRKSVQGGERVNLDVLDAEQQLFGARRDLAQARHEYLRAWLQLRYLAGVLEAGDLNVLNRYFAAHG